MTKKCTGCGVLLQASNTKLEGYTSSLENDICSRCFKLKNYGEYQDINRSNEEYEAILKAIDNTKDLVLYVVDLLNLSEDLKEIRKFISNKMILVLTKRDVLPKSVKDEKLLEKISEQMDNLHDLIVVSSEKNYNLDELMALIKKHKSSKNVYVVGLTNAGKSSLINKLIKNYSDAARDLTISPLPSTTIDTVEINISDDLNIIDTPGLIETGNINNYLDIKDLKKISPKKEIKPKTFQLKAGQCLIVEDFLRLEVLEGERSSFTCYFSNDVKVKRHNAKNPLLQELAQRTYDVDYYEDIVIPGLGFIKVVAKTKVEVYANINIKIFLRPALI